MLRIKRPIIARNTIRLQRFGAVYGTKAKVIETRKKQGTKNHLRPMMSYAKPRNGVKNVEMSELTERI